MAHKSLQERARQRPYLRERFQRFTGTTESAWFVAVPPKSLARAANASRERWRKRVPNLHRPIHRSGPVKTY